VLEDLKKISEDFVKYYSNYKKISYEISSFERIFGGASRETYKVELSSKSTKEKLIYRRTQQSSLIETEQITEYLAFKAFEDSIVPVPRIHLIEEDEGVLGAPFIILEQLDGEAASPFQEKIYSPNEKALGMQFWTFLGEITKFDIKSSNLNQLIKHSKDPYWKQELDKWVKVIREDSIGVEPILEVGIRDLYRTPPNNNQEACLVHGDYRNGNFLFKGDTITGILDWEMAHIGDPLEDLSWALSPIWCWKEQSRPGYLIDRAQALEIWKKTSGLEIDPNSLSWWELFSCIKGLAIWISAGNEFITQKNNDPINLFSAWIPGDIHLEIILEKIEKRWKLL
tara:strand:- start:1668 stop:2687 length:1020 start_codon:yes stop_codon:yes gene_type:complete